MTNKNNKIYVLAACRTPIGKLYGSLSGIRPDDLTALVITDLLQQSKVDASQIDHVMLGCANQAGEDNRNIARQASILAGLPMSTNAVTFNSLCASGMEAIISAARTIYTNENDVVIAGGVESMSRSPWVVNRTNGDRYDSTIGWRFVNPKMAAICPTLSMPETAELLSDKMNITKAAQDKYAYESRQKYQAALAANIWQEEVVPVVTERKICTKDEQHRLLSLELLSKLPTLVPDGQYITAGNAARVGDGAALVVLASADFVAKHQLSPIAVLKNWAVGSCHPSDMGLAAAVAAQKLLTKSKLTIDEINRLEINESFAVQTLACQQQLGANPALTNVQGGALSMGNPIGMGAARLVVSLAHQLKRMPNLQYGLAATSAGLGIGNAILLESCYGKKV